MIRLYVKQQKWLSVFELAGYYPYALTFLLIKNTVSKTFD